MVNYQVLMFDRSVNDFFLLMENGTFNDCLEEVIDAINKDIDASNREGLERLEYDEAYEIFNEGRNYIINNHVYGIISINESNSSLFADYLVLISGGDISEKDITSIEIPFNSEVLFRDYMKRFCLVSGSKYQLISPAKFDEKICSGSLKQGVDYDYIVHTKINFK